MLLTCPSSTSLQVQIDGFAGISIHTYNDDGFVV